VPGIALPDHRTVAFDDGFVARLDESSRDHIGFSSTEQSRLSGGEWFVDEGLRMEDHPGVIFRDGDSAYLAWAADRANGRDSLLLAATRVQVTALNARARADRLAAHPCPPAARPAARPARRVRTVADEKPRWPTEPPPAPVTRSSPAATSAAWRSRRRTG